MKNIKTPDLQTEPINESDAKVDSTELKKVLKKSSSNRFIKEAKNKSEKKIADIDRLKKEIEEIKDSPKIENKKEEIETPYLWPRFDLVTPLKEGSDRKQKRNHFKIRKEPEKTNQQVELNEEKEEKPTSQKTIRLSEKIWKKKEKEANKPIKNLIKKIFNYDKKNERGKTKTNTEYLWPRFDLVTSLKEENNITMETANNTNNQIENNTQQLQEPERVAPFIENANRSLWSRMTSGAKEIMSNAYEGIYMTPGLNKVVGKMEIAYNQFWIDKKEGKAVRLKNKMDSFGARNNALEEVKTEVSKAATMLEELGLPGSATNLREERKIENKISKNENRMDKLQSRIEDRENRMSIFANKRDAIADRLITHYEKKLSPIEGKLSVLEDRKNEIELFCVSSEVKIDEQKAKIKRIEETRAKREALYIKAGYSDRQIKKDAAMKELNNQISSIYTGIQLEQAKIAERRNKINEKVAKVNKKAEPYRNKKNEFIRIKNNRPVDFGLKERKYADEWKGTAEVHGHPREPGNQIYERQSNYIEPENSLENIYPDMERFDILTERWNVLVVENSEYVKEDANGIMRQDSEFLLINPDEIEGATRIRDDNQMTKENFLKIVEQFYKVKKIKKEMYQKIINKFIETK